jgi:hypothetical protein
MAVPVFTIMLLGRWSSDAFLHNIRWQVKEFSKGVSEKMVAHDDFFIIPEISTDDPRIFGHHLNHCLQNTCGPNFWISQNLWFGIGCLVNYIFTGTCKLTLTRLLLTPLHTLTIVVMSGQTVFTDLGRR